MPLGAVGGNALLLLELGGVLIGLGLLARLADRIDISAIPLFLLAGLALGQVSKGPLSFQSEVVAIGADIGLVLLLFLLGLEYTGSELASSLRSGAGVGVIDAVLNFFPGFAVGLIVGWEVRAAVLLGGVTYISSSGIVSKVIHDLGRIGNRETPAILSLLVTEDFAMALFLPLIAVLLATTGLVEGLALLALGIAAAASALFVAIRWSGSASRVIAARSDETLLLTTLGLALLVSGAAQAVQLSAAVGAFLAGIIVSGPVADRARELLAPVRDLFAAAFFVFFGLSIDAGGIPPVLVPAIVLVALTIPTKILTGWWAAGKLGARPPGRLRAGTVLIARGEFSIVIAGLGVSVALEPDLGPLAAAYVLMSAIIGSVVTRWANDMVGWVPARIRSAAASSDGG